MTHLLNLLTNWRNTDMALNLWIVSDNNFCRKITNMHANYLPKRIHLPFVHQFINLEAFLKTFFLIKENIYNKKKKKRDFFLKITLNEMSAFSVKYGFLAATDLWLIKIYIEGIWSGFSVSLIQEIYCRLTNECQFLVAPRINWTTFTKAFFHQTRRWIKLVDGFKRLLRKM